MTEIRKGEIALALIKNQMSHDGLRLNSFKRALGNVAKETGISLEELLEFNRIIIEQLMEETFGKRSGQRV